jgi:shikimate dehydrogenase
VISGGSRLLVLLGDPVAHSLSPAMQNAAIRALGLGAVYVPFRCLTDDVGLLLRAVARSGGGGNVTVPHKQEALRALDVCRPWAETVEACNTFWSEDGGIVGDNTDVPGVLEALHLMGTVGGPWYIAGTGGAARAAVVAAVAQGVGVAIGSRDAHRQRSFERWVASKGVCLAPAIECRVLINATPLGLNRNDPLPINAADFPSAEVAFDMVYAQGETPWVRAVRSRVRRAADGRAMLVAQGAAAFERWFPKHKAPVEIMRAAVDVALR